MSKTPMMQQYEQAKATAGEAILLFRMGDFYELFHDDAKVAAKVLGLTLTSRDKSENPVPMAGFPHHQLDSYLAKLIRAGYRVAVCDQVENPQQAKGLVRREVTRILSPGTITDNSILEPTQNNYLIAVAPTNDLSSFGLAWVELSTGQFVAAQGDAAVMLDLIERLNPAEALVPQNQRTPLAWGSPSFALTTRPDWTFSPARAKDTLYKQFHVSTLEGFGFDDSDSLAIIAAAAIVHYLSETQAASLDHINVLHAFRRGECLEIDQATWRSLEISRTIRNQQREGSLLATIDRSVTAMGSRLLGQWLMAPLVQPAAIEQRQDSIAELVRENRLRENLRQDLKQIHDLERVISRVFTGRATPRDLKQISASLTRLPGLRERLVGRTSYWLQFLQVEIDPCPDLQELLDRAIVDDAPLQTSSGGYIRPGYDSELDDWRELASGGKRWIAEYQQKIIQESGIGSLKVGFNKVFGYYIEVTNVHQTKIPDYFIRKQTLKNVERYITPELKEYEDKVLSAEQQSLDRELLLFDQLRETTRAYAARLKQLGEQLAMLDLLAALAELAVQQKYCRPEITTGTELILRDGRHPVLDIVQPLGVFVPNDTCLDAENGWIHLITGPNMAGKSTYIRQVALITLMAQIGSFVPAKQAMIGIVDRIFARVGASDELSRGQSTFMVEMTETARILNTATSRSLVILDEIGRGTSTYDGVSLAWAIAEYLHEQIGCRTLFATHYHELTELEKNFRGVKNYNVSVREWEEKIVFLHKIIPGGADKSYGIHVAQLAGVPDWVNRRAQQILNQLQSKQQPTDRERMANAGSRAAQVQLTLFEVSEHPLIDKIKRLDTGHLTPLSALEMLHGWQQELQQVAAKKSRVD